MYGHTSYRHNFKFVRKHLRGNIKVSSLPLSAIHLYYVRLNLMLLGLCCNG